MDKIAVYKEQIIKEAKDKKEKDANETQWMKDRVVPAIRSEGRALAGGAVGAAVGAVGGAAGSKATSAALKRVVNNKDISKTVSKYIRKKTGIPTTPGINKKVVDFATNPKFKKARLGLAAASGAASWAPVGARTGRVVGDMRDLEKKTRKELHREPTEKEYKAVARLSDNNYFDRKVGRLINNPNAIVKSNLRERK